jgi:hypothetical protein
MATKRCPACKGTGKSSIPGVDGCQGCDGSGEIDAPDRSAGNDRQDQGGSSAGEQQT